MYYYVRSKKMTNLYLAIPCYNEEEVLRDSAEKLLRKYESMMSQHKITFDSKIVFIDDGSKDKTWQIIEELHNENPIFQGIKLSRNRGHQNALLCGLMTLKDRAEAVISIDADLQDDIEVFDEMVAKYEDGCDVVYGVRSKRATDTFFKRFTAEAFYKILNRMGAKVIFNHADFRLMSKRALEAFSQYKETNIFLRGMVPLIGYKSDIVTYERFERLAGESKYPLKKMLALAWEGITSLSIQPIRIITWTGVIIFLISMIMVIYSLVSFFVGAAVSGWASTLCSIWALGGLQLLAIRFRYFIPCRRIHGIIRTLFPAQRLLQRACQRLRPDRGYYQQHHDRQRRFTARTADVPCGRNAHAFRRLCPAFHDSDGLSYEQKGAAEGLLQGYTQNRNRLYPRDLCLHDFQIYSRDTCRKRGFLQL